MLILLSPICTFVGLHDSRTSSDLRENPYMHWSAENGWEESVFCDEKSTQDKNPSEFAESAVFLRHENLRLL